MLGPCFIGVVNTDDNDVSYFTLITVDLNYMFFALRDKDYHYILHNRKKDHEMIISLYNSFLTITRHSLQNIPSLSLEGGYPLNLNISNVISSFFYKVSQTIMVRER